MERFMEFEKNIEKNFNYDKIFRKIDNIRFQQEYDNKIEAFEREFIGIFVNLCEKIFGIIIDDKQDVLLHIINIIDNIKSNPKTTAKTITAGKAANTAALIAAPIINPITTAKETNKITATNPKHFTLLHFCSLLS